MRCFVCLLCVLYFSVFCQNDAQANTEQKAKLHNEKAREFFNLGKFKEAALEYEKAYQAKPFAVFLYNMGQCHMRMDKVEDLKNAIHYFESYLRNEEKAPNKNAVEKLIKQIKEKIVQIEKDSESKPVSQDEINHQKTTPTKTDKKKAVALTPEPVKPDPLPEPVYKKWWFWTLIGVVVAGATVGIAVGVTQNSSSPPEIPWSEFALGTSF